MSQLQNINQTFKKKLQHGRKVGGEIGTFNQHCPYLSNSAEKKGYSGTAIITKVEPVSVKRDIGIAEHDQEGRVLCLEFHDFFLVNVYVPNSGNDLRRLDYRQNWDQAFFDYLNFPFQHPCHRHLHRCVSFCYWNQFGNN